MRLVDKQNNRFRRGLNLFDYLTVFSPQDDFLPNRFAKVYDPISRTWIADRSKVQPVG